MKLKLEIDDTTAIGRALQHARDTDSTLSLSTILATLLTWQGHIKVSADRQHDLFFRLVRDDSTTLCGGIIYHADSNTWSIHT